MTTINLTKCLVDDAKLSVRSTPKQIEFWCKIGKIAEENPRLNFLEIIEMLKE